MKNEEMEEERYVYKVVYSKDLDRIYVFGQKTAFGENYVVLINVDGRTEERVFSCFEEAKKFAREVISEIKAREMF